MIVTERFIFLHLHKTGGQSLAKVIKENIPDYQEIGYHFPYELIPKQFAHLPVLGVIRNPWDWYVSWYAFNQRPNSHNPLFLVAAEGGQADFKTTLANLAGLGADSAESVEHRRKLIEILPESLAGNRGVGLTKTDIRSIPEFDGGYYSWLSDRMLGISTQSESRIGRFENLQDDFLDNLNQLEVPEASAIGTALSQQEHKNSSRHTHYSHYYDDESRELVAELDRFVIDKYDYAFEMMGPANCRFDLAAELRSNGTQAFQKLVGRAENYLLVADAFDVSPIKGKIAEIPLSSWAESERKERFHVHTDTQSLHVIHFEDFRYTKPEILPLYNDLADELEPIISRIGSYYRDNGFVVRVLLAKLLAGGKIAQHRDGGYSLLNCHRVHIPIVTNEAVQFAVGGEIKSMRPGEFWEINNGNDHAVQNAGTEDRIHLIVDWMPNHNGKSVEDAVTLPESKKPAIDPLSPEALDSLVAESYRRHQAGDVHRAETGYRHVLEIDEKHVNANNLLGLLCLQSKRPEKAEYYIRRGLAVESKDARSYSNLGLALKDQSRFEEALEQFRHSLEIDSNNPNTYCHLGNIFRETDQIANAIASYEQALRLQPGLLEAHHNLGGAYLIAGQYERAIECYRRALEINPNFAASRHELQRAESYLNSASARH